MRRLIAVAFATLALSAPVAAPVASADCRYGVKCCTPHQGPLCIF